MESLSIFNPKQFKSNDGLFSLTYPKDWSYELQENYIHCFYDAKQGQGALQISSYLGDETTAESIIKKKIEENYRSAKIISGNYIGYSIKEASQNATIYRWILWRKKIILHCTYVFAGKDENELQSKKEIETVKKVIESIKINE